MSIDYAKLREPFPASDIEWRVQSAWKNDRGVGARVLAYITNRAIQARLDEVIGPESWQNVFTSGPAGGVMCGISIQTEAGEWVTKWDGADNTDIEKTKGGLSSAMKRAAVQWGIGRYLYDLEAGFAQIVDKGTKGAFYAKTKEVGEFHWLPPALPQWALPEGEEPQKRANQEATQEERDRLSVEPVPGTPTQDALDRLEKLMAERGVTKQRVAKASRERFGKLPSELQRAEFVALWNFVDLGEWRPEDVGAAFVEGLEPTKKEGA